MIKNKFSYIYIIFIDMFVVLFMIPRCVGWLAHWKEFLDDKENKIVRPRQNYIGKAN